MSDREKWLAFLAEMGIPREAIGEHEHNGEHYLELAEGEHERITGYHLFCTRVEFDASGKFLRIGAWE